MRQTVVFIYYREMSEINSRIQIAGTNEKRMEDGFKQFLTMCNSHILSERSTIRNIDVNLYKKKYKCFKGF